MEKWKDIPGFSGYQVSNEGRVRTFRKRNGRKKAIINNEPKIMSTSDDGNGYQKLMLYSDDGRRYCKKVHRLVAEAFVPNKNPVRNDTVDHKRSGPEGKLDNSAKNLKWVSRRENIQKAYRDGVCDDRIRQQTHPVIVTDLRTNEEHFCNSIREAGEYLNVDYTSVSHAITDNCGIIKKHYLCEKIEGRDLLLYDEYAGLIEEEFKYY